MRACCWACRALIAVCTCNGVPIGMQLFDMWYDYVVLLITSIGGVGRGLYVKCGVRRETGIPTFFFLVVGMFRGR